MSWLSPAGLLIIPQCNSRHVSLPLQLMSDGSNGCRASPRWVLDIGGGWDEWKVQPITMAGWGNPLIQNVILFYSSRTECGNNHFTAFMWWKLLIFNSAISLIVCSVVCTWVIVFTCHWWKAINSSQRKRYEALWMVSWNGNHAYLAQTSTVLVTFWSTPIFERWLRVSQILRWMMNRVSLCYVIHMKR